MTQREPPVLTILAATSLTILPPLLIIQWSVNKGFLQYLSNIEQSRMGQIIGRLEQAYADHGSWDFLKVKPRFWMTRLSPPPPEDFPTEGLKES